MTEWELNHLVYLRSHIRYLESFLHNFGKTWWRKELLSSLADKEIKKMSTEEILDCFMNKTITILKEQLYKDIKEFENSKIIVEE